MPTGLERLKNFRFDNEQQILLENEDRQAKRGKGLLKLINVGKRIDFADKTPKANNTAKNFPVEQSDDPLSADYYLKNPQLTESQKDNAYSTAKESIHRTNDPNELLFKPSATQKELNQYQPDRVNLDDLFQSKEGIISPKDFATNAESTAPRESTKAFQKGEIEEQFLIDEYGVQPKDLTKGNSKKAESVLAGISTQAQIENKKMDDLVDAVNKGGATQETINEINQVQSRLRQLQEQGKITKRFLTRSQEAESGILDLPEEIWKTWKYQPQEALGGFLNIINQIIPENIPTNLGKSVIPITSESIVKHDSKKSALKQAGDWMLKQGALKEKELKPKTGFWGELGKGAASVAMAAPLSIGLTAASGNPVLGFAAGFTPSFILEGGLAYKEAKDYGLTDEQATTYSLPVGLINAAIEQVTELGIGKEIAKRISREVTEEIAKKGLLPEIAQAFAKGARSGGFEGLTQEITNLTAESIYKNSEDKPKIEEWIDRVGNSSLYEAILSGFMAGGSIAGQKVAEKFSTKQKTEQSTTTIPDAEKQTTGLSKLEEQKKLLQNEEGKDDRKNITGLQSSEQERKSVVEKEFEQRGSGETVERDRILQASEQQVEKEVTPFEKFTGSKLISAKEDEVQDTYDLMKDIVDNKGNYKEDDVKQAESIIAEIESFNPETKIETEQLPTEAQTVGDKYSVLNNYRKQLTGQQTRGEINSKKKNSLLYKKRIELGLAKAETPPKISDIPKKETHPQDFEKSDNNYLHEEFPGIIEKLKSPVYEVENWANEQGNPEINYYGYDKNEALKELEDSGRVEGFENHNQTVNLYENKPKYNNTKLEDVLSLYKTLPKEEFIERFPDKKSLADFIGYKVERSDQIIESKDISPINETTDEILSNVQNKFGGKYPDVPIKFNKEGDPTEYMRIRIADHTGNYYSIGGDGIRPDLSIVISNQDPTLKRFGRSENEIPNEYHFDEDSSYEEIIDFINSKIEEKKADVSEETPATFESKSQLPKTEPRKNVDEIDSRSSEEQLQNRKEDVQSQPTRTEKKEAQPEPAVPLNFAGIKNLGKETINKLQENRGTLDKIFNEKELRRKQNLSPNEKRIPLKNILSLTKGLNEKGINAKYENDNLFVDGKKIYPITTKKAEDLNKVEIENKEAKTSFEELAPEEVDRQNFLADVLSQKKYLPAGLTRLLPTGFGQQKIDKAINDIKQDAGREQRRDATIFRDFIKEVDDIFEKDGYITFTDGSRYTKPQYEDDFENYVYRKALQQTDFEDDTFDFRLDEEPKREGISDERQKEIIINRDPAELEKLAEDIESKAESEDETELNEAIREADKLILTPPSEKPTKKKNIEESFLSSEMAKPTFRTDIGKTSRKDIGEEGTPLFNQEIIDKDQQALFQKEHVRVFTVFEKLSESEKEKFLTTLQRGLAKNWGAEFKNLSDMQASGVTYILRKVIELDPETANFTTLWEELFHQSMIALARPNAAQRMLREAGWNGQGEIWDVRGNKSLEDAHEKLANEYIDWVIESKEPSTTKVKIFSLLKNFWNKIAAFLYQLGLRTHAGYFEMLYSGKLKADAEVIDMEDFAQSLAQEIKRDKNFKLWFGDSKVVDETGKPLIVFHGTNENFDAFTKGINGFFFTADPKYASKYSWERGVGSQVYPIYLKLENPFIANRKNLEDYFKKEYGAKGEELESYIEQYYNSNPWERDRIDIYARNNSHDGIIIPNDLTIEGTREKSYVVFNPTQIKSIFNRGTFDPNDQNILHQKIKKGFPEIFEEQALFQRASERQEEIYSKDPKYYLDRIANIKDIFELRNWVKKYQAEIDDLPRWEQDDVESALKEQEKLFGKSREIATGFNKKLESRGKEFWDNGFTNIKDWREQMLKEFGESVKPRLPLLFNKVLRDKLYQGKEHQKKIEFKKDLTEKDYNKFYELQKQKKTFAGYFKSKIESVEKTVESGSGVVRKLFKSVDLIIEEVSPKYFRKLVKHDQKTERRLIERGRPLNDFLKGVKKFAEKDLSDLIYAMFNGDGDKLQKLFNKYQMNDAYQKLRKVLDEIGEASGLELSDWYFPRMMKDYAGFLKEFQGLEQRKIFEKLIQDKEKKYGLLTDQQKALLIDNALRGDNSRITLSKLGNEKDRVLDLLDPSLASKYYYDPFTSLGRYIIEMTEIQEARKFFNQNSAYKDAVNIGDIIIEEIKREGLDYEQANKLKGALLARFQNARSPKFITTLKKTVYIEKLAQLRSAVAQLKDLSISLYKSGTLSTIQALYRVIAGKNKVSLEDIGVLTDKIAPELSDPSQLNKLLDDALKYAQFTRFDSLGKTTFVNAYLGRMKKEAGRNSKYLHSRLDRLFTAEEKTKVIDDLKNGKTSDDIHLLLYSELSRTQPISKSALPIAYSSSPIGRIAYTFRTFAVRRLNFYIDETRGEWKRGNKSVATKNFLRLAFYASLWGASVDLINNILLGRPIDDDDLGDMMLFNLMDAAGVNRYLIDKFGEDQFSDWMQNFMGRVPIPLVDNVYMDIKRLIEGKDFKGHIVKSVPIIGVLVYERLLRGDTNKKWKQIWVPDEEKNKGMGKINFGSTRRAARPSRPK